MQCKYVHVYRIHNNVENCQGRSVGPQNKLFWQQVGHRDCWCQASDTEVKDYDYKTNSESSAGVEKKDIFLSIEIHRQAGYTSML